jgi:hypothetical protein
LYLPIFETLIAIEDSLEQTRLEEGITTFCAAAKSLPTSGKEAIGRYANYFEKLVNANSKLRKVVLQPKFKSVVLDVFPEIELPTK